MPNKIGGGNHIQLYDKSDGRYSEQNKKKSLKTDLDNLKLVHKCGLYYGCLKFPFPINDVHDKEYCKEFVEYVAENNLCYYGYIEDEKLSKYLFVHRDKDDKSKFVIEILGYPNNKDGWEALRHEIITGTDYSKMFFNKCTAEIVKVKVKSTINSVDERKYNISTIWELKSNMTLKFIAMIPGGK